MEKAQQEASDLACIEYISCMFIRAADQTRSGGLKTALDNQFLLSDIDQYPETLSGALKFLKNFKVPVRYQQPKEPDGHVKKAGLSFLNDAATGAGKATNYDPDDVACYGCGKRHRLRDCPSLSKAKKGGVRRPQQISGGSSKQDKERCGQPQR